MRINKSVQQPIRSNLSWEQLWKSEDLGLIACWERGRQKRLEEPALASKAEAGELVVLPWKGGVERELKKKQKYGSLKYLAMWQGLRGQNLDIETDFEVSLVCKSTSMTVVFTDDLSKLADA